MADQNRWEDRLRRIEDYIAIQQLIASYGPAADSCNMEELRKVWGDDPVYDARGLAYLEGEEVFGGFDGDYHRALVAAGSAHSATMPYVVLDGDKASATNYAMLYKFVDGRYELVRLNASRWLLRRTSSGWRVYRRTNRLTDGAGPALEVLRKAAQAPAEQDDISY